MDDASAALDSLLGRLETGVERSQRKDAIDEILSTSPRKTSGRSLRDHDVVRRFRRELSDGLIRADTASRLISLIQRAVEAALR